MDAGGRFFLELRGGWVHGDNANAAPNLCQVLYRASAMVLECFEVQTRAAPVATVRHGLPGARLPRRMRITSDPRPMITLRLRGRKPVRVVRPRYLREGRRGETRCRSG